MFTIPKSSPFWWFLNHPQIVVVGSSTFSNISRGRGRGHLFLRCLSAATRDAKGRWAPPMTWQQTTLDNWLHHPRSNVAVQRLQVSTVVDAGSLTSHGNPHFGGVAQSAEETLNWDHLVVITGETAWFWNPTNPLPTRCHLRWWKILISHLGEGSTNFPYQVQVQFRTAVGQWDPSNLPHFHKSTLKSPQIYLQFQIFHSLSPNLSSPQPSFFLGAPAAPSCSATARCRSPRCVTSSFFSSDEEFPVAPSRASRCCSRSSNSSSSGVAGIFLGGRSYGWLTRDC